ncbi:Adhesion and hyphal regulator 1 [Rhizoctonia solani]|uniref:Adhesion and hyphal regulator 1 n=1 Tax=Rhizoctonia solani TaxID=456999 RepID=A0A0K6G168_9AGAM|nr:Adhesion and hyphal regulator 1 [Rhizoctonia solani]
MSAITRSTNGCLTCKHRKKKCDETRPSCTRCINGDFECLGYDHLAIRGPRQRKKKPVASSKSNQTPEFSSSSSSSDSTPTSVCLASYSRHTPGLGSQQPTAVPLFESNHIFQAPQIRALDPDHVVQMFIFYSQPTRTSVQPFRPFPFSILHAVTMNAKNSILTLKSTYVGAKIKKAVLDGAGLSIGIRLIDDFQRQITNTIISPDMNVEEIAELFNCLLSLVLGLLQIVNTPVAHSVLRKAVPFFLALAAKYPEMWADDLSISIRHAFSGLRFQFSHFAFLDTVTALVFGTIPLIHYDTNFCPILQPPKSFYIEWAHGCSSIVIVLLARVNSWRAARLADPMHPTPTLEEQQQFQDCLREWNPTIEYGDEPAFVMGRLAVQETWRHAVLIYMYMGMCGADTADPRVEASVRQVAQLSATIETDHPLETHMTIPCIIAAAAARKEKHRAILRKKVVVSRGDRVCLIRGADFALVLDHLWHGAAAGGYPTTWQDYVDSRFAVLPVEF